MIEDVIKKMKINIVLAAHKSQEGHIASAFSILDLVWILYDKVMSIDYSEINNNNNDRFVLSKGHASLALYSVLAQKKIISEAEMDSFCEYNGKLGGHPDCNKLMGIEASTGSLGHGLPIAVGLALGSKINGIGNKIFCLIGDGECNEGTVWESALLAAHHKLSNLCCVVDFNHSTDRALKLGNLSDKFTSFGWDVIEVDGHDHNKIEEALSDFPKTKPLAIIAETIKGKGVKRMEHEPAWHHRSPNMAELKEIIEELT